MRQFRASQGLNLACALDYVVHFVDITSSPHACTMPRLSSAYTFVWRYGMPEGGAAELVERVCAHWFEGARQLGWQRFWCQHTDTPRLLSFQAPLRQRRL